ncbi:unnamed protein product, partial [Discosporangium mesarthrocarpum]
MKTVAALFSSIVVYQECCWVHFQFFCHTSACISFLLSLQSPAVVPSRILFWEYCVWRVYALYVFCVAILPVKCLLEKLGLVWNTPLQFSVCTLPSSLSAPYRHLCLHPDA